MVQADHGEIEERQVLSSDLDDIDFLEIAEGVKDRLVYPQDTSHRNVFWIYFISARQEIVKKKLKPKGIPTHRINEMIRVHMKYASRALARLRGKLST